MPVHLNRTNQALLAQMSEVAFSGVERPAIMVAEFSRRDDAEAADDAQGAGFRFAKRVFPIPVAYDLAVQAFAG